MEQALDAASDLVRYEAKKLEDQQTSSSSSSGGGDDNNFDENNINLITSLVAILQEISKSGSFAKVVKNLTNHKAYFGTQFYILKVGVNSF